MDGRACDGGDQGQPSAPLAFSTLYVALCTSNMLVSAFYVRLIVQRSFRIHHDLIPTSFAQRPCLQRHRTPQKCVIQASDAAKALAPNPAARR
jgi:hypothetical protein